MKASTHTGSTDCIHHAFSTNLVKVMKSTLLFGCCCHLRPNIRGALCSFAGFRVCREQQVAAARHLCAQYARRVQRMACRRLALIVVRVQAGGGPT